MFTVYGRCNQGTGAVLIPEASLVKIVTERRNAWHLMDQVATLGITEIVAVLTLRESREIVTAWLKLEPWAGFLRSIDRSNSSATILNAGSRKTST